MDHPRRLCGHRGSGKTTELHKLRRDASICETYLPVFLTAQDFGAETVHLTHDALLVEIGLKLGKRLAPDFLHFLNIHRDRIARERIRLVLFLHRPHAEQFMLEAGDLWDFRHQAYWLDETPHLIFGQEFWQSIDQHTKDIPKSDTDQDTITRHIKKIRKLVGQTDDNEEKVRLLLDLSHWLHRRQAWDSAAQVSRQGLHLIFSKPSQLKADLEIALGYSLNKLKRSPHPE